MKTATSACLVAAILVLGSLHLAADQIAKFRHVVSIYADDKGGGLSQPEGVACGAGGQIVVADTGNDRLVRFTFKDKTLTGGTVIKLPEVSAPSRLQVNSKGEIYALDTRQRRVVRIGPEGDFKGALAFNGAAPGTIVPKAFVIDIADTIYVLDVFSARVLVLSADGKVQRELALPADLGFAADLAVDSGGTVLVLDAINRRLFSAAKDAGSFAPLGGDLTEALGTMPTSMTTSKGSTFVLEGSGSSVVSFRADGSFMARQLAPGVAEGSLNHPAQMCVNDKDEAFIADRDNSRVQVFQLIR
jgi:sugar lactone lactonase YvrE